MTIDIPEKFAFLFEPARYKVAYGGRGGAKSWAFADALLIQGRMAPQRILCAREIQKSMKESVHQLLQDRIKVLGLTGFYEVLADEIRGRNGTLILFAGLRHNIDNIKSKEAIDKVWVEEARTVSKTSWKTLIPTIRKPGSEIWVSFNPELEDDETYQRFVVKPPPNWLEDRRWAYIVEVSYKDNPFLPEELRLEAAELAQKDPDDFATVYGGQTRQWLDGAVYANELRAAALNDQIKAVPYVSGKPVDTFWDLGEADMTAIWFVQRVGMEWRVIDYLENSGQKLPFYVKALQAKPYAYGTHWMPHDAENETMGSPKSIAKQAREFGFTVRIVAKASVVNGINAARTIFDQCYFDRERCADGLNCLRNYQYEIKEESGKRSKEPLHNWASHGADAFRYFAVAAKDGDGTKKKEAAKPRLAGMDQSVGWMA